MALHRLPVRTLLFGVLALFLAVALIPSTALAKKESPRLGQYDAYIFVEHIGAGDCYNEQFPKALYKEESGFLYGAGFGKSVHKYFNVGMELYYANPDLTATVKETTYEEAQPLRIIGGDVFVDLFAADWFITPLVTGSVGLVHYHSEPFGGPANSHNTYIEANRTVGFSDLNFTYSLGAGLRWDISKKFMVKGVYQQTWRNLGGTAGGPLTIEGIKLEVGYKF